MILNVDLPWPVHAWLSFVAASCRRVFGFQVQGSGLREGLQLRELLNTRHMMWAWVSLFWVGFTDVYIRLCATGHLHDYVFFTLR